MNKTIVIIAGPTASGKSGLAFAFAQKNNAAIVNADSMQVYSSFPILSAQPDAATLAALPHHLYGTVHPPDISTAASWRKDAIKTIHEIFDEGQMPIVVGGTGMYLEALMHGISEIPDVPKTVREKATHEFEQFGGAALREKLISVDNDAARLMSTDTQRIIRAYAVLLATGKSIGYWQKQGLLTPPDDWIFKSVLLMPEREKLYVVIDARFTDMLERGAVEEVKAQIPSDHPSQKALGVKELQAFLKGEMQMTDAIEKASQFSRNYAKRQMTWFNNRFQKMESAAGRNALVLSSHSRSEQLQEVEGFIDV